ncbi:hypothetical protein LZ009_17855 [Ramlibacter sp. XY19]|uniref:hypothetical protein n=1 Tax=Ramlibacter paludis TaxID=2908000 RepID=UPI0023DA2B73|nr:hypothetical protein [Ramlibacter paludis]MCG2594646.1 hypothetical protein [Ramlibacter paludis]
MVKFLVLALFYGDHPELAQRCGATLRALWNTGRVDLRIGLNEVSPRTRAVLDRLLPGVDAIAADPQIYKYPMMRKLIATYAGDATHMMWFDDDSCLLPGVDARAWLAAVTQRTAQVKGSLGSIYRQRVTPAQRQWLLRQPWAGARPLPEEIEFNTGGWKVVPLALMRRFDYPPPGMLHGGGDLTLGALLQQQGLAPEQFRAGLAINADAQLRESAAQRRGVTEAPHGEAWQLWGGS